MSVRTDQVIAVRFPTYATSGANADADALPTATLYINGTANGATVTVTNVGTGLYKAAVTVPALAADDRVSIEVAATIGGTAVVAPVWADGAGGGLTTEQDATLTAIANATNRISTGGNTFRSPVQNGTIVIGQGSALTDASTTPITIPQDGGNWPDLSGYTVTLTLKPKPAILTMASGATSLDVVGTATGAAPDQTLTFRPGTASATLTPDGFGKVMGPAYLAQAWAQQGTNGATAVMLFSGAASVVNDIRS